MKNIAIVGAGASGLVCAITCARAGLKVDVFEKHTKPARKILASGNGRCNLLNKDTNICHFHSQNPSFVLPSISVFSFSKCLDFFCDIGIEVVEGEKGRLYPRSLCSSSVAELLFYECKRLGVGFEFGCEVLHVQSANEKFALHAEDKKLIFDAILIATGGMSMPSLGGSQSGYEFAKKLGHNIIEIAPSLVQLESSDKTIKEASGVKVDANIEIYVENSLHVSSRGDVLFADYGVSGSAVLDVSRVASVALQERKNVKAKIDIMPSFSKEELRVLLQNRLKKTNKKSVSMWLDGLINKKLTSLVLENSSLSKNIFSSDELTAKDMTKLAFGMKNIKIEITGTKGFKSAEVTAGGVDTKEVDAKTMMSKKVQNLYFSGEVLDVDGDCGGYNLYWAWASGFVAGHSMAREKA
ncbi:MAG: NAD(P)/FAD-dependent oxidoreductase [Sulfurospirillaceae bacterium]|nr:NAD(P)/FAD-dependent oxidoreductase [Sulfurospirillaceae bacterium]